MSFERDLKSWQLWGRGFLKKRKSWQSWGKWFLKERKSWTLALKEIWKADMSFDKCEGEVFWRREKADSWVFGEKKADNKRELTDQNCSRSLWPVVGTRPSMYPYILRNISMKHLNLFLYWINILLNQHSMYFVWWPGVLYMWAGRMRPVVETCLAILHWCIYIYIYLSILSISVWWPGVCTLHVSREDARTILSVTTSAISPQPPNITNSHQTLPEWTLQ